MWNIDNRIQFEQCIDDLIDTPSVLAMRDITQHIDITCLDHCIFVAYVSFLTCRFFHLDFVAAARGGLLHDLFLYDWHKKNSHEGLHGFTHPKTALRNASALCELSDKEKDIIVKHMWPLTMQMPKYKESFIVSSADKICALAEIFRVYRFMRINQRLQFSR